VARHGSGVAFYEVSCAEIARLLPLSTARVPPNGKPMNRVGFQPGDKLKDAGILCGRTPAMQTLNAMVEQLAATNIPVLLVGESGTGKDVYARMIHWLSGGSKAPLVKISCATIDAVRLQSEVQMLQTKEGGNAVPPHLFLDGVEELDGACQNLLLTYVPDGVDWGGGTVTPRVRVISATCRDLDKEVKSGRIRREFYFRINGACLRLPPLRERREDIAALLEYFLQKHSQEMKKAVPELDQETINALLAYEWPGNIRELENLARSMVALGEASLPLSDLRVSIMDLALTNNSDSRCSLKTAARAASRQREQELILAALERTQWNRKRAAQELQVSYKALLYKLKQIEALGTKRGK
jgi:two-component system, NtrC family, response regulator AtoC